MMAAPVQALWIGAAVGVLLTAVVINRGRWVPPPSPDIQAQFAPCTACDIRHQQRRLVQSDKSP